MKFTKMQGCGNNYIYVNCFEEDVKNRGEASKFVSDIHFGIGSDGLICICPSDKADCMMDIYNADGSQGKMCGNGVRCVAKYVYDNGIAKKDVITVETLSGIKTIEVKAKDGKVYEASVDMGEPILKPSEIPVLFDGDTAIGKDIEVGDKNYKATFVSMGNPHAVVYVDDVNKVDIEKTGPLFENHRLFPDRINTEFIKVIDSDTLDMRVWERGSGETFACGTGACAAAVSSVLNGFCKKGEEITIHLRGGDLKITWLENNHVRMIGPAVTVCTGEIDV